MSPVKHRDYNAKKRKGGAKKPGSPTGKANLKPRAPKVSVIVPAYNTADTIDRCLDSIFAQTLQDFEVVVVDDGSPDDVYDVAARRGKADAEAGNGPGGKGRVRIVRQENKGLGAARNTGIRSSTGEFLAFVDSDDFIEPRMLELMVAAAEAHAADMTICQCNNVVEEAGGFRVTSEHAIPGAEDVISGSRALDMQMGYTAPFVFNSVCFKLVRRGLFEESGVWFPEEHRFAEDIPTSVGLMANAGNVALVRENLYDYVHDRDSLTTSYSVSKAVDIVLDAQDVIDYTQAAGYEGAVDNYVIGLTFAAEKQLVLSRAFKRHPDEATQVMEFIRLLRGMYRPQLDGGDVPFVQKVKVRVAYDGRTPAFCAVANRLKWIPAVRRML